jgi:IS5 family transposase
LGYESLCQEVTDSISWRRFCRIGLDRPVPHPTTLIKLVRRAGPQVIEELNAALVAKLAADKLLRGRKLRVDTTVVEADIDHPPTLTCWSMRSASSVDWYGASRLAVRPAGLDSGTVAGRRDGG